MKTHKLNIMIGSIITIALSVVTIVSLNARVMQDISKKSKTAEEAARYALTLLPKLVNDANFEGFGFKSAKEISDAQLDKPIALMSISYDQLMRQDQPGKISALASPTSQEIFPVLVEKSVRTSILVVQKDNYWTHSSLGGTNHAFTIQVLEREFRAKGLDDLSNARYRLVDFAGLSMEFYNLEKEGKNLFIARKNYPEAGISSEELYEEEKLLRIIKDYQLKFHEKYKDLINKRRLVD